MKCWIHASEIVTGEGIRKKDGIRPLDADMGRIPDGAIVVDTARAKNRIEWVGPTSKLPREYRRLPKKSHIDLEKKSLIMPGMIDAHTHTVFAGDRADEFARRAAGTTYEEIRKEGGGIQKTMRATREASPKSLFQKAISRVEEMSALGVRTVEIKTGYGLDLNSELKCLRVIQQLKKHFSRSAVKGRPEVEIIATYLGAHDVPPERTRAEYLEEILSGHLPFMVQKKLADHCDIFVDQGYFDVRDAEKLLGEAKRLGLGIKIHADELGNTEATAAAVRLGALSADHLLKISDAGIAALAKSQTVGVLLPGTAFYLRAPYAPARRLIDAGARVAIATDFNPGSCMCLSLPMMMTLGALYMGMSRAEIFAAVTYNAARALGISNRKGTLLPNESYDGVVLPIQKFEELYYRFGWTGLSV